MGFMDFFRTRKTKMPLLKEGIIDKNKKDKGNEKTKINMKVFSKKSGSNMEYSIEMLSEEGKVTKVGKIYSTEQSVNNGKSLRDIVDEIKGTMSSIEETYNRYELNRAKEKAKSTLQGMSDQNPDFVLDNDVIEYIDDYQPEQLLNYERLMKLPTIIDLDSLTNSELVKEGKKLQERLDTLMSIKSPEDAYNDRENLVYYMKTQENAPLNPIVNANIQSIEEGKTLDDETVIRVAKNMEQLNNEDGTLYSVYLKIEEKRIWKKIKTSLEQYCNNVGDEKNNNEMLSRDIKKLDEYELQDVKEVFSTEMLEYIINDMKQMDIENYTRNIKAIDTKLTQKLNSDFIDIPDRIQILQFLHARMGSLGQLSYKSTSTKNNNVLRNFVANTDFKHEDNSESKQFLFLVAQIEKDYIEKRYGKIIEIYKEKENDDKSFKERISVPTSTQSIKQTSNDIDDKIQKVDVEMENGK